MALSENDRHDATLRRKQSPASDMGSFVPILRQRLRLIGLVTLVFALAGLLYVATSVPKYLASGRIFLDRPVPEVAPQIAAMTSPAALDRIIVREKLETDPLFGGKSKGALSLLLSGLGLAPATDPHALALRQLERVISVKRDADSNLVDVSASTQDRDTSARIANAVIESYIEATRGQVVTARGADSSPDGRLKPLEERLKEAEQRLEKYRRDAGITIANDTSTLEKQVNVLSGRLASAEARVSSLRSALARQRRVGVDPDTIRGGVVDVLRRRYAAAKRLQDDLSRTLGPRHPDMVIARLQATDAKRSLDQAVRDKAEDRMQSSAAELERARTAVADLKGRLDVAKNDLSAAKNKSGQLRELEAHVEISRSAYQALLAQSRDPAEQERSITPRVKIVSRATPPLDATGTPRLLVLLTSILTGYVAGTLLALLLALRPEWTTRSWKVSRP